MLTFWAKVLDENFHRGGAGAEVFTLRSKVWSETLALIF